MNPLLLYNDQYIHAWLKRCLNLVSRKHSIYSFLRIVHFSRALGHARATEAHATGANWIATGRCRLEYHTHAHFIRNVTTCYTRAACRHISNTLEYVRIAQSQEEHGHTDDLDGANQQRFCWWYTGWRALNIGHRCQPKAVHLKNS